MQKAHSKANQREKTTNYDDCDAILFSTSGLIYMQTKVEKVSFNLHSPWLNRIA